MIKFLILFFFFFISKSYSETHNVLGPDHSIQAAIDSAQAGDTVLVYPGHYIENIVVDSNLTIGSLFLTTSDTSYIIQTIIDGDSSGSVVTISEGLDTSTVLAGLTIINGYNSDRGGGINIEYSGCKLEKMRVFDNHAEYGGGIWAYQSIIRIYNSDISYNCAETEGAGAYLRGCDSYLKGIVFKSNILQIDLKDYITMGAGLFADCGWLILDNGLFDGNLNASTTGWGGGFGNGAQNLLMKNVTFRNNYASQGGAAALGGGFYKAYNCLFYNNTADSGGAIYFQQTRHERKIIANSTFYNNQAQYGPEIFCENSNPLLVNVIINNERDSLVYFDDSHDSSSIRIVHSNISGGQQSIVANNNGRPFWLDGNISEDPLFNDPAGFDFTLNKDSKCIDAGITFYQVGSDTLLNLMPEDYVGSAPDMGAFEYVLANGLSGEKMIGEFSLGQNYPNPFNLITNFEFRIFLKWNYQFTMSLVKRWLHC